jgi:hypothetical protein
MVSVYDAASKNDQLKQSADVIYKAIFSKDTTTLNELLGQLLTDVNTTIPDLSKTFKTLTNDTLEGNNRVAKHGLLFFGIYLNPTFANQFIHPEPRVDPTKFSYFYNSILPGHCVKLLEGKYVSLWEFVEEIRSAYIML